MAFGFSIPKFLNPVSGQEEAAPFSMADPAQELFDTKAGLLNEVATAARAENRQPTLEDYYHAAERFGASEQGLAMTADGKWNMRIAADLSGQTIDGFKLCDPNVPSQPEFRSREGQEILQKMHQGNDGYDQDGDGKINAQPVNQFMAEIRLDNATVQNCWVEPASSFNEQIAKAKSIENVTFSDMVTNEQFTFGQGTYDGVTLRDFKGGDISFNGAQVNNLDMSNTKITSLTIDSHTYINGLNAENAHIVRLNGEAGARIENADFINTTIDPNSTAAGMSFAGVTFANSNLREVNFSGATISNSKFVGCDLNGIDFTGTSFSNLTIDGKLIKSIDDLPEGITVDGNTRFNNSEIVARQAKQEAVMSAALEVGKVLARASATLQESPTPAPAQASQQVDASMGHYEAMNRDIAKPQPAQPQDQAMSALANLVAQMGGDKYTTTPSSDIAKPGSPSKDQEKSVDLRSYYQQMSANGGRSS